MNTLTFLNPLGLIDRFMEMFKKRPCSHGPNSDVIWSIEDELKANGWTVNFYDESIPDMSANVDYAAKVITVNISSAHYARILMDRIKKNVDYGLMNGAYVYQWQHGEVIPYNPPVEDLTEWNHQFLSVKQVG